MFALLVTLGAFGLILVLARFRVPLWVAILAGSIAVCLLLGPEGRKFMQLGQSALAGATAPQSIGLILLTILLLGLSVLMRESGQLERIVELAHSVLRRPAVTMMAMPALVGLLPMPGGAIFSAPMVETASGKADVPRGLLSAINYWFRHVWEYFWPLYPGVILAMELTGLSIPYWSRLMLPASGAMILGGLIMLRGTHPDLHAKSEPPPKGAKRKLLRATASIWIILLVWAPLYCLAKLFLGPHLPLFLRGAIVRYGPLTLGLLVSILWTIHNGKLGIAGFRKAFAKPGAYSLALLILAIMIFQHTLEDIRAPYRIAEELKSLHVPMVLVVMILPFIAGFVTGVAVGFVGTAFPIVLSIVGVTCGLERVWIYIPLAYGFGHMGQMLSPIHVCQILSNKFFGTTYGPVYRYLLPSAILTASLNAGYFLLLRWLG
ncbi:MAG: DUF401 family protein [Phycisphaerae bacterium]|nr:DUF401 family protein [Phycisphaerae bacterium]